jgi:protoporphyrin/coproporphyrin ferrochelatase
VPVLLTAHSLPKRVFDAEPGYIEQLKATASAVALAADLAAERWSFVYQSAGHTPEEWLKPDLLDVLPVLAADGHRDVIVAPVQFLADHLETLYDVDVAGREQALTAGFASFTRVDAPNSAPDFIAALKSVVESELAALDAAGREAAWLPA